PMTASPSSARGHGGLTKSRSSVTRPPASSSSRRHLTHKGNTMTTNISAGLVKELRERTGAGMMECKKALAENGGDIDAAAEWLRKSGLAKADKKADRVAAEGRIVTAQDG